MTILHIITGLNDGGAEAVLYRLCTHSRSAEHHVVSLRDLGKYGPLLEAAGIKVSCVNMPRGRVTPSGLLRLYCLLRTVRPEIVQTWMYHADLLGGVLARMARIKLVFWGIHHTTLETGKCSSLTIWVARINAWLSRWIPSRVICCAERARAVHVGLGYDESKFLTVPNGYDLLRFKPDLSSRQRLRSELNIDEGVALIGMVGRFHPQKDHGNLIAALAILKERNRDFCCLLAGTGLTSHNREVRSWIEVEGLGRCVRLLGQRNDIPAVMNALDLHVLASAGEAFPNVLAEAMACGTPCVTTDVGDAATIVGDTGWVVPPRNPNRLADAIEQALAARGDETAWEARRASARRRIEDNFGIERMVRAYRRAWQGEAP